MTHLSFPSFTQWMWIFASSIFVTLTDFYLPATPQMTLAFQVSSETIQMAVPYYFLSMAMAALLTGFLAEKYGLLVIFRTAFVIILAGSTLCCFSQNISFFFMGRCFQGVGAGLGGVTILALIRTSYPGEHATKIMAKTGMTFVAAPAIAQWIGSHLTIAIGWQACFAASAFLSLLFLLVSRRCFSPLRNKDTPQTYMTLRTLFYHYRILLRNKKGLALLLIQPFVLGGLWCYRSSLPFILLETYDVSLESYSYYLAPMIIVHLLFSFLAQETVLKVGSQKLIQAGVGFLLIGAMSEILIFMLGWVTPLTFTLAFLPFVAGYSLSLSTSLVTGIGRFNIVTLAASMTVFLRMIGCALGGVAASYFDESSILGLNMFLLSAAVVSILLYFYAFSHRKET